MRLGPVVPLVLAALSTCAPGQPSGKNLTIDVVLALEGNRCVVRFADTALKDERRAIAWTAHSVIWKVQSNGCGEKTKTVAKALGLKYLKRKKTGTPAAWLDQCSKLDHIPARIEAPLLFECKIPSSKTGDWEGIYEYEIDGDSVEPVDPGLDVKRNG
jgi:hypothetical protein